MLIRSTPSRTPWSSPSTPSPLDPRHLPWAVSAALLPSASRFVKMRDTDRLMYDYLSTLLCGFLCFHRVIEPYPLASHTSHSLPRKDFARALHERGAEGER